MMDSWVTRHSRIGDVVEIVPGAVPVFVRHGVDPGTTCSTRMHELTLGEVGDHCGLRDVNGLIRELNSILARMI